MKYYDSSMHLPAANLEGLGDFLRHIDSEKELAGGNLVLSTLEEVEFVEKHVDLLPVSVNIVPTFLLDEKFSATMSKSGWFYIHPRLHRIDRNRIQNVIDSIALMRPKGIMVDCYPWGVDVEYNVSLPLVIAIAKNLPDCLVLANHGGGYESWAFRAHASSLKNVIFDFSLSFFYYQNSDILRPFQRYLVYSRDRVVFGSDWPNADCASQIAETIRLANEVNVSEDDLENIFLKNSMHLWRSDL